MRLDKPIGTLLLLWPALWGLWLARRGRSAAGVLAIFLLGVLLMRSAGCVDQRLRRPQLRPHVERTRDRPLAAGDGEPCARRWRWRRRCSLVAFVLVLQLNALTICSRSSRSRSP